MEEHSFWHQKKVFITGHTGFKGSWLTLWLTSLGAQVIGYSLPPTSTPNLFEAAKVSELCTSIQGDINDYPSLLHTITKYQPQILLHLAAQPLVRPSYREPVYTFATNVLGIAHVLEAARHTKSVQVIVNITSDKCYQNDGLGHQHFKEQDPLGGHDPYSASKACAEIVSDCYRKSFWDGGSSSNPVLATARAGNVIGGGDWSEGRLFPDIFRAAATKTSLSIRNRTAIRPWQHVLEPLQGYIQLAEKCWGNRQYAEAWNFGPTSQAHVTVDELIRLASDHWGEPLDIQYQLSDQTAYEVPILTLDSSKAVQQLAWQPKLSIEKAVEWTVAWYQQYQAGADIRLFTQRQIEAYIKGEGV
ncbi:CDP-glucose 4,6-dehydratase [Paenibacillus agilis]|uniref:CDP-glucose 4,6-dehydratase n=1 Tax=Paenibacillus agilis TaxID=3020863 RepID=A0A559IVS1_9BACL|nr:CDP-glucose 4,6-dehydratase [Paenibacillus agilis]TVX91714.1 CDP-glucose 4,6-dehydratase [Paenibacillus agilis]